MIPLHKQWGCRPTQSGSHIHIIHIQGVWQPSYAVDGHMEPSLLHFHGRCYPRFQIWEISQNLAVIAGRQMIPLHKQWGLRPTQSGSHIHIIHIQGVWQPSYAVDGHMKPSPLHIHGRCYPGFGKFLSKILSCCWAANDTITQAMRLKTHPEWFTHPCHTYTRCLTTFICCGWAYETITTSFSWQVLSQIWEISQNPEVIAGQQEWYHYTSNEALDPPRVVHTSMSYIYKVFDNLRCGWTYGSIITLLPLQVLAQSLESFQSPGWLHRHEPCCYSVIEA
jgi:hypothetical protein